MGAIGIPDCAAASSGLQAERHTLPPCISSMNHRRMVSYRRARIAGGTYFFTVTLRDRRSRLLLTHIDILGAAFRSVRWSQPFEVNAIVVLPEHLHTVWTLPPYDADFSSQWKAIKSLFTRSLKDVRVAVRANRKREHDVWQRRFWEHLIVDDIDYTGHVDYIHWNPVKHGLVNSPMDWRWSSVHRHVRTGLLPAGWIDRRSRDLTIKGDD